MKKLYIYGNGGEGKTVAVLLEKLNIKKYYSEIVFINDFVQNNDFLNIHVCKFDDVLNSKIVHSKEFIIAVGEPYHRKILYNKVIENNFIIAKALLNHNFHYYDESSSVDVGTVIHKGVNIGPEVKIGKNCLLNTNAVIGHNTTIGNNCVISPGVIIAGGCSIGDDVYVGSGAIIREKVVIENEAIIGMGAVVTKNVGFQNVVVGNPAKFLRINSNKEVFKK